MRGPPLHRRGPQVQDPRRSSIPSVAAAAAVLHGEREVRGSDWPPAGRPQCNRAHTHGCTRARGRARASTHTHTHTHTRTHAHTRTHTHTHTHTQVSPRDVAERIMALRQHIAAEMAEALGAMGDANAAVRRRCARGAGRGAGVGGTERERGKSGPEKAARTPAAPLWRSAPGVGEATPAPPAPRAGRWRGPSLSSSRRFDAARTAPRSFASLLCLTLPWSHLAPSLNEASSLSGRAPRALTGFQSSLWVFYTPAWERPWNFCLPCAPLGATSACAEAAP
jgi:hypothetical protein